MIVKRSLWECYKKPSPSKIEVWNDWLEYAHIEGANSIEIYTHNNHFISLKIDFKDRTEYIYPTRIKTTYKLK